jgi:hypothetical protein
VNNNNNNNNNFTTQASKNDKDQTLSTTPIELNHLPFSAITYSNSTAVLTPEQKPSLKPYLEVFSVILNESKDVLSNLAALKLQQEEILSSHATLKAVVNEQLETAYKKLTPVPLTPKNLKENDASPNNTNSQQKPPLPQFQPVQDHAVYAKQQKELADLQYAYRPIAEPEEDPHKTRNYAVVAIVGLCLFGLGGLIIGVLINAALDINKDEEIRRIKSLNQRRAQEYTHLRQQKLDQFKEINNKKKVVSDDLGEQGHLKGVTINSVKNNITYQDKSRSNQNNTSYIGR